MSIHIVPQADEQEHVLDDQCSCKPVVEWQDPETGEVWGTAHVIHNAFDCREAAEQVTGDTMAPGKGWEVIVL